MKVAPSKAVTNEVKVALPNVRDYYIYNHVLEPQNCS
jgi:hypothetical protein